MAKAYRGRYGSGRFGLSLRQLRERREKILEQIEKEEEEGK